MKSSLENGISGNRIKCGASPAFSAASPADAAIQPACRPMTSKIKTLVEVAHIEAISRLASLVDVATYFATDPKPGLQSVSGKSLSIVFGM